ncbi:hypothetical protein FOZ76_11720 [Verticiella sediminum]|uniref:Uncharacterized protein n=1 Tax=Verticiella sediminum TaxID=1247510 RepID=A0A556API8_9BURK|nr:hypothetical protein [Verticiella sediminum]TSH94805.1 hypothetical protein FOZ76_11720 [Verticiella sediminum]
MNVAQATEVFYPWVLALAAGAAGYYFDLVPLGARLDAQLSATLTVSSILMGFLGTAKAIVLTTTSSRRKWLSSRPEVWHRVIGFFKSALFANLALSVFSLLLFFVDPTKIPTQVIPALMPLWLALVTGAIFTFFRAVNILFLMVNDS